MENRFPFSAAGGNLIDTAQRDNYIIREGLEESLRPHTCSRPGMLSVCLGAGLYLQA